MCSRDFIGMRAFIQNIIRFYRQDCCWPYAASFFLALIIFWQDFFIVKTRFHWASLVAYGILLAYYLYNVRLYFKGRTKPIISKFSIGFLSAKVLTWGAVLIVLYVVN